MLILEGLSGEILFSKKSLDVKGLMERYLFD